MTLTIVPAIGELLEPWPRVCNTVVWPVPLAPEEGALRNDLTVAFRDRGVADDPTVVVAATAASTSEKP